MASEVTKERALDALTNMATIVKADMLTKGEYLTPQIVDERRKNQVCQGHRACAIGSLWIGAGVKFERVKGGMWDGEQNQWVDSFQLPGVHSQDDFVEHRPALRLALASLDRAAEEFIDKNEDIAAEVEDAHRFEHTIESLFETEHPDDGNRSILGRDDMLKIIRRAKTFVRNA